MGTSTIVTTGWQGNALTSMTRNILSQNNKLLKTTRYRAAVVTNAEAYWDHSSICGKWYSYCYGIFTLISFFQRSRRIWILDRQAAAIGQDMRDDLGNWLCQCLDKGVVGQGQRARAILEDCGVSVGTLRKQWELQRAAQLSIRARECFLLRDLPC
jgi:hypothetical protein